MKLLYLVDKFSEQIQIISRRKYGYYNQKISKNLDESGADMYHKAKILGKYSAINLDHKDTIEFRMFRGTLCPGTLFNTLEFVSLLAKVSKELSIDEVNELTWEQFTPKFSDSLRNYYTDRLTKDADKMSNAVRTIRSNENRRSRRAELSEDDRQLNEYKKKIKKLKKQLKYSRNALEKRQLSQEIETLNKKIKQLRNEARRSK